MTLNCLGLTAVVNLHRTRAGSHLIYIPETAQVLGALSNALVTCPDAAEPLATNSNDASLWSRDTGYKFIEKYLPSRLEGGKKRLLDVGCSVGQLMAFLKDTRLWGHLSYLGVDADEAAVHVARHQHPGDRFDVCDAQQSLVGQFGRFDIVVSKGTICSTHRPLDTLKSILECAAQSIFLVHTPCTTSDCGDLGFATTLYSTKADAYIVNIVQIERLKELVQRHGFRIALHSIRRGSKNVLNLGTYRLHDLVLERAD